MQSDLRLSSFDEDMGIVLLQDSRTYTAFPSHTHRLSLDRPGANGVVLYDPHHSSTPAPKSVQVLPPPPPRRHHRSGSQHTDATSHTLKTGAIRPGGTIRLLSRGYIGLAFNFGIIGLVYGITLALAYPLLKIYFHMPSYQQSAASALLGFGWAFKFGFGLLSDCFPIRGQRRKPYAMIGLGILLVFTLSISVLPHVEPYMKPKGVIHNPKAARQSDKYVVVVMFASFGHALLDAACEGYMVELSQREGDCERGRIQGALYGARYVGAVLGSLLVALGCNNEGYGGDFSFGLPLSAITGFVAVVSAAGLYATYYHLSEEQNFQRSQPMYTHVRSIWRFAERRATWQLTIVFFLQSFAFLYKVPQSDTIYQAWLKGDTLTKGLSNTLSSVVFVIGVYLLRSDGLRNVSWRTTTIVTTLFGTSVGVVSAWLLVENIYRDKILNMLLTQVVNFCDTFPWMIGVLVIVEIAEPGYEASCYTLLTTIYNLAVPLSAAAGNMVSASLGINDDAIVRDTPTVRRHVLAHFAIMYGLRVVLGIGTVFFLPPQKREIKTLMQRGNPNAMVPFVVMITFLVLFAFMWTLIILSMFHSTACLGIVGGHEC